jgi:DNA helicase HerA-like ATPase
MPDAPPPAATPTAAELAALRATAARAAAEAAEARLTAAEAALAAAEAAAAHAPPPVAGAGAPSAEESTPAAAAPRGTDAPPEDPWPGTVAAGYAAAGATVALGALVVDGVPRPDVQVGLPLSMMNRHGLVAGATGTGKTRTLQGVAEELSEAGVPVFLADVKGDLSGLASPGVPAARLAERARGIGQEWAPSSFPVEILSLGGVGPGTPVRTTVTDFGPLLLAKVLDLNETQESSLALVVHWADTQGLALLDLEDLRATIAYLVSPEGKDELRGIGGISTATAGVILREIVALQAQGADAFFGEPAFDTRDLLRVAPDGRGVISALELPALQDRPALFSTFLMWLLADLFQGLPEVGDAATPRLVFFFDEAHLLFTGASKDFLTQVIQTVRLIRSKGVGVFFVTQTPKDVPADVLAQLGHRVQHALRAFTPDDATALRATVRTFPDSPYDLAKVLTNLGTGEAVITALTEKGTPSPVAWTRLRAPRSLMAPAPAEALAAAVASSPLHARYATAVDRESAAELLAARVAAEEAERATKEEAARLERMRERLERDAARGRTAAPGRRRSPARGSSPLDTLLRSAGTQLGREITRTIFGTRRR